MTLLKMADASTPPAQDTGCDVMAGYIGGDTPHVWTKEQWADREERYLLPIFTRSNPGSAGEAQSDAEAALAQLKTIGAPAGCLVALDFETAVNSGYVQAFQEGMGAHPVILYGSLSYVRQNPKPHGGYWSADWNDQPVLAEGCNASQYADADMTGRPWDLSVVAPGLPLWEPHPPSKLAVDGLAGPATCARLGIPVVVPPVHPPVEGDPREDVKVLQEALNRWGHAPKLEVDGLYGPLTMQTVRDYQESS